MLHHLNYATNRLSNPDMWCLSRTARHCIRKRYSV